MARCAHLEVEAAVNACVCGYAAAQFVGCATVELGHRHGSDAVLDIYGHGLSECDATDIAEG